MGASYFITPSQNVAAKVYALDGLHRTDPRSCDTCRITSTHPVHFSPDFVLHSFRMAICTSRKRMEGFSFDDAACSRSYSNCRRSDCHPTPSHTRARASLSTRRVIVREYRGGFLAVGAIYNTSCTEIFRLLGRTGNIVYVSRSVLGILGNMHLHRSGPACDGGAVHAPCTG